MLYKSILVPYDKTEPAFAALAEAIRFCNESPETELHIVTMVDSETRAAEELNFESLYYRGHGVNLEELETLREEILLDEVIQVRSSLREKLDELSNLVVIDYVETGNPSEAILTYADENGCDVIIMGCRGMGLLHSLGSVSRPVLQHAKVPVVIVKSSK